MNPRYFETFRRHRLLFVLPIVLAGVLATWVQVAAPPTYRSGASLWSETGGAAQAYGAPPPAAEEQSTFAELLTTRQFQTAVARRSGLAAYLATHESSGGGPSALLAPLRSPATLDDRVAAALGPKLVTSSVKGPHVLAINYDGPTPELAVATLRALISEFSRQRQALRSDALSRYEDQVTAVSQALATAQTRLSTFLQAHPGVSSSDPQLKELVHAERLALEELQVASDALAEGSASIGQSSAQATLRVIDRPTMPTGPTTGRKRLALGIVGGLFAGALISICLLYTSPSPRDS